MRPAIWLFVILTLAPACSRTDTAANNQAAHVQRVTAEIDALADRCGLTGHFAYELHGSEFHLLGVDPRFGRQFASCLGSNLHSLGLEMGVAQNARDYRFMGPPEARPADAVLDDIERRMVSGSCVTDLDRWSRKYAFRWEDGRLNSRVLYFTFRELGPGEDHPGRAVFDSIDWFGLDDSPVRMAGGTYDVVTRRLSLEHCGPNYALSRPQIIP